MSDIVSTIGIIGGTALTRLPQLTDVCQISIDTPFGDTSSDITQGIINQKRFVFIARHGSQHNIPPHLINYRANIWAMQKAGVGKIVSVASVGSINKQMSPGVLVVPDQIIDYTWGRAQTFFDQGFTMNNHVEFTHPYDRETRQSLLDAAKSGGQTIISGATMGVTQGPRLETAAEIKRLQTDGCDLVGMTGMPEAALARELSIPYACFAVVVNWAAGIGETDNIDLQAIQEVLNNTTGSIDKLLSAL